MYVLSSKSGSEPFNFALFLGDFKWNDPVAVMVGTVMIIFSAISRQENSLGPTRGKT